MPRPRTQNGRVAVRLFAKRRGDARLEGEEQTRATPMVKATNVIYHDKARPSALIVPIVP